MGKFMHTQLPPKKLSSQGTAGIDPPSRIKRTSLHFEPSILTLLELVEFIPFLSFSLPLDNADVEILSWLFSLLTSDSLSIPFIVNIPSPFKLSFFERVPLSDSVDIDL
ncbi:hypothetical protein AYI70_g8210 [Smittium culicis]|uniref:Uncharacterized protein n=1 Tax=Smittium culicis TaxID=133412 RepID=A0A1R1XH12_9FUNG|nr:hypothetical protein AYI70_g8210 [Smittium culicis]